MSDTTATETVAAETSGDNETTTAAATEAGTEAITETTEGESALGDAGKKALDAMKAKWKDADKLAKDNAAALAALQAKLDGKEAEFQAEQAKREAEQAGVTKFNERILKSEVKAAAKGVLADPQDAYKFLDLDSFEVDDDGNVDESAIASALTDLITAKPYLAAQGKRFQGTADGGARTDASKVSQLTRADMARMSPEQIETARTEGRFDDLLNGK